MIKPSQATRFARTLVLRSFLATSAGSAAFAVQPAPPPAPLHIAFEAELPSAWQPAHYQFTHPLFDTDWSRDNLQANAGLRLSLTPQTGAENRFLGASLRHTTRTHYGRYEVRMQPAKAPGVVTGFFTYSGPYYGTQHDEIDIEFLGHDTTRINLAWFVDGEMQDHFIPLGFDAADAPRTYAFEWHPDRLRWFVEDQLLFEITDAEAPLPQVPGYLFTNIWAVDDQLRNWAGYAPTGSSAEAHVDHITFTPFFAPNGA